MRSAWIAGAVIIITIGSATAIARAAEIRLAEQFSMGYLQFNVMKRDKLIEKYATQRGLKDFKVSWQRFNGPVAMNEALLSNSTDIVSGGVPGLITLWDKTQGTSFEVKGICALSSQPFLLNTANPDIKSIKDFTERDRIAVPFGSVAMIEVASLTASRNAPKSSGLSLRNRAEVHATVNVCGPSTSNDDSTVWFFCSSCWNWNGGTLKAELTPPAPLSSAIVASGGDIDTVSGSSLA